MWATKPRWPFWLPYPHLPFIIMSSNLVVMNLDRPSFYGGGEFSEHMFVEIEFPTLDNSFILVGSCAGPRGENSCPSYKLCSWPTYIFETIRSPKQVFKEEQHPITYIFDWLIESGKSQSPYYCLMSWKCEQLQNPRDDYRPAHLPTKINLLFFVTRNIRESRWRNGECTWTFSDYIFCMQI